MAAYLAYLILLPNSLRMAAAELPALPLTKVQCILHLGERSRHVNEAAIVFDYRSTIGTLHFFDASDVPRSNHHVGFEREIYERGEILSHFFH